MREVTVKLACDRCGKGLHELEDYVACDISVATYHQETNETMPNRRLNRSDLCRPCGDEVYAFASGWLKE